MKPSFHRINSSVTALRSAEMVTVAVNTVRLT